MHPYTHGAVSSSLLQTAKHMESLVANSPIAKAVAESPSEYKADTFPAVFQSDYEMGKKYINQYDTYLIKYLVDWEHTVSTRVNGLLIHYKELQQNALHYQKKVSGLHAKVDKSKNVSRGLSEKLDRNEVKEMGANEARDTVGQHVFLLIDEVTERVWRDIYPLLLRALRFEADFSAQQSNLFSNLNAIADDLESIGKDYDCELLGRLDDIAKKHPVEIYTVENPFVQRKTLKSPPPQPILPQADSSADEEAEEAAVPEDDKAAAKKAAVPEDNKEVEEEHTVPEDEKAADTTKGKEPAALKGEANNHVSADDETADETQESTEGEVKGPKDNVEV